MDIHASVRAAVGAAYDPKADYVVVRPAMVGQPKYADCTVAGEFVEDTRNGTKMVVLLRPAPATPPPAPRTSGLRPVAKAKPAASAEPTRSLADLFRGPRR